MAVRAASGLERWAPRTASSRRAQALWQGLAVLLVAPLLGLIALRVATSSSIFAPLLLVLAVTPFVALVVGSLKRLLLAIVIVGVPLHIEVNFGYREDLGELGAIAGLSVSATTVALAGLYAMWLAELLAKRGDPPRPRIRPAVSLIAFTGFTALSLLVARDRTLSAFELFMLVEMLLLFIYVASTVRSVEDVRFVAAMLLVALLVESLLVVAVFVTGADVNFAGVSASAEEDGVVPGSSRAVGTFGSPNTVGIFLSLLLAPAVTMLVAPLGAWVRRLAFLGFSFGTVALILTFSRGGWLAFAISMAVLTAVAWQRRLVSPRVPIAVLLVVAALAVPFHGAIVHRLTGDDRGAAASRGPLNELALRMIEDHPVLGVGANNFALFIPDYAGPEFMNAWLYTVHNKYLQVWSEAGTAALLAFLWFLFVTLRRGWRTARASHPVLSPLALGVTVAVLGEMVTMGVETFHGRPHVHTLWLLAALVTAMARLVEDGRGESAGASVKRAARA